MLTSVDLNNESSLKTREVDDVGTKWNLTAEGETIQLARAQMEPQVKFRIGHAVAQPAGTLDVQVRGGMHRN
jgi:hypothetical protein